MKSKTMNKALNINTIANFPKLRSIMAAITALLTFVYGTGVLMSLFETMLLPNLFMIFMLPVVFSTIQYCFDVKVVDRSI